MIFSLKYYNFISDFSEVTTEKVEVTKVPVTEAPENDFDDNEYEELDTSNGSEVIKTSDI